MRKTKTKEDYQKELRQLKAKYNKLAEAYKSLRETLKARVTTDEFLKSHAEKMGSEAQVWKVKYLKLEEEYNKVKN